MQVEPGERKFKVHGGSAMPPIYQLPCFLSLLPVLSTFPQVASAEERGQ